MLQSFGWGFRVLRGGGGGGGILPEKLSGGVQPASQNPYPIHDQNLWYSPPYLWPDHEIKTLFQTCVIISSSVQTNVNLICEGLLLIFLI